MVKNEIALLKKVVKQKKLLLRKISKVGCVLSIN